MGNGLTSSCCAPTDLCSSLDGRGPLHDFFLGSGGYGSGFSWNGIEFGYQPAELPGVTAYRHLASGIYVWGEAVEFSSPQDDNTALLFHYTTRDVFLTITKPHRSWRSELCGLLREPWLHLLQASSSDNVGPFAFGYPASAIGSPSSSSSAPSPLAATPTPAPSPAAISPSHFIGGVLASSKEPSQHHTKEAVLRDIALWSSCLGAVAPAAHPAMEFPKSATALVEFCIPLLVPREWLALGGSRASSPLVPRRFGGALGASMQLLPCGELRGASGAAVNACCDRRKVLVSSCEAEHGIESTEGLAALCSLAAAVRCSGKLKDAEKLLRAVLKSRESLQTVSPPVTLSSVSPLTPAHGGDGSEDLVELLIARNHLQEAAAIQHKHLEKLEASFGPEQELTLLSKAISANILRFQFRHQEAVNLYRKVHVSWIRAAGEDSPEAMAAEVALAEALLDANRLDEAEGIFRQILRQYEEPSSVGLPSLVQKLSAQASLALTVGVAAAESGKTERLQEHEEHCAAAVLELESAVGVEFRDTALARARWAALLLLGGKMIEASAQFAAALASLEVSYGNTHPRCTQVAAALGSCLANMGKHTAAEPHLRRAFRAWEASLGPEVSETIGMQCELARSLKEIGKVEEAASLFKQAVASSKVALGENASITLERACYLGDLLHELGHGEEAEQQYRWVQAKQRACLGEKHPETLEVQTKLGDLLTETGSLEEAEKLHREVWAAAQAEGNEAKAMASAVHLASALQKRRKFAEAEPLLEAELLWREKVDGIGSEGFLASVRNFARFFEDQGRFIECEALYRRSLASFEEKLGADTDHPSAMSIMADYAQHLVLQDKLEKAEKLHRHAMQKREARLGPDHPDTLASLDCVGALLQMRGELEAAEKLHMRALAGLEAKLGSEDPTTLRAMANMANLLACQERWPAAEAMHRQVLQVREAKLGPDHEDTIDSTGSLANILVARNKADKALPLVQHELAWHEQRYGKKDERTLQCARRLSDLKGLLGPTATTPNARTK